MSLRLKVLRVVSSSEVALTVREVCCLINGKSVNYCQNVDGCGGRCIWFYRRPKHESQRIRLVKPNCTYTALQVMRVISQLVKEGKLKRVEVHLRDELSTWNHDKFKLIYVNEEQLRKRLGVRTILDFLRHT